MIRKLSAHYIFPISAPPVKYGILSIDSSGKFIELINRNNDFREIASLEFYNGILVPGFLKHGILTDLQIFETLKNQFINQEHLTLKDVFTTEIFDQFVINHYPGVSLISNIDFEHMRLTSGSQIKILVSSNK